MNQNTKTIATVENYNLEDKKSIFTYTLFNFQCITLKLKQFR